MRQQSFVDTAPRVYAGWNQLVGFVLAWFTGVVVMSMALSLAVYALTPISQSYTTTDKVVLGSMVSLESGSSDKVVAASSNNADNLLGVVISAEGSFIALQNGQENQVQVATSGTAAVLVSDVNGEVLKGDFITPSPIAGIGMKASSNVRIIGTAQSDLAKSGPSQQKFKDKSGVEQTVSVGQISVFVNVSSYFREPDKTIIPSAIQNIANGLAGRTVSTLPILISGAIFVIMLIIVMSIIYSMIRSSIISIGRNPMSQSAVYRDLIQLSGLVLVILSVGLISIYLVLSRIA